MYLGAVPFGRPFRWLMPNIKYVFCALFGYLSFKDQKERDKIQHSEGDLSCINDIVAVLTFTQRKTPHSPYSSLYIHTHTHIQASMLSHWCMTEQTHMHAHSLSSFLLLYLSLFALISSLASCCTCLVCVRVCVIVGGCLLLLPELVNLLDCRSQSGERQRKGERDTERGRGEWKRQRDEEWVFKDEDPVDIIWDWKEVVRRETQGFALFHKQLRWRGCGDLKTTWNESLPF